MSFRLVPLIKGTGPTIALQRPVLLIGRHPECDVRIDTSKISRRHCCVAIAYDRVLIRDLGSRNKVRVNGRVIEEARLQAGDEIAIGPILYRIELLGEKQTSPTPVAPQSSSARPSMRPGSIGADRDVAGKPMFEDSGLDLVPLEDL